MCRLTLLTLTFGATTLLIPSHCWCAPNRPRTSRDPFQPPQRMTPNPAPSDSRNLNDYALDELKLTAIITTETSTRLAILENSVGIGFTIRPGTEIGPSRAKVLDIQPERVLVQETLLDREGMEVQSSRELMLHAKE